MSDETSRSDAPIDRFKLAERHVLAAVELFGNRKILDTIAIAANLTAALALMGYSTSGIRQ